MELLSLRLTKGKFNVVKKIKSRRLTTETASFTVSDGPIDPVDPLANTTLLFNPSEGGESLSIVHRLCV